MSWKRVAIATAVVAAVLGGVTATSGAAGAAPGVAVGQTAEQDGRQLFTGVVLGQGPVADQLADAGLNPTEVDWDAAGAVAAIEADSPGYFADFSEQLRSGDPAGVEAALEGVGAALEPLKNKPPVAPLDCPVPDSYLIINDVLESCGGQDSLLLAVAEGSDLERDRTVARLTDLLRVV